MAAGQKTMYRNITIRHNLIRISIVNGIFGSAWVENCLIEENVILGVQGQQQARLVLNKDKNNTHWNNGGATVRGNLVPMIEDESKDARLEGNVILGTDVSGLFVGITNQAGGDEPEHWAPTSPVTDLPWVRETARVARETLTAVFG